MEAIGCSNKKAIAVIKELDTDTGIGLIERKRQGQGNPAMILATTILFYIVCIFAEIYGLAAAFVNFIAMVGVIMFLFSLDWLQLGITLSILVVSYLMLDAWGVVILFIAKIREVFTDILIA